MEINCSQMDVLISFYIEGDLSKNLQKQVENHLEKCKTCRTKYEIIKSMFIDLQKNIDIPVKDDFAIDNATSKQYKIFQTNLSAYVDNELSPEENIKIKKFTINNKDARKELEDIYNIRKLMSESFRKAKTTAKPDFSNKVIKQLDLNDESCLNFHPLLKYAFAFIMTVLVLSAIIIFCLSFS